MALPTDPRDPVVEVLLGASWVDAGTVGGQVLARHPITIRSGRANWGSGSDPSQADVVLANRDGRWSPDYPSGAYAGTLQRNLPCRVGVHHGGRFLETIPIGSNGTVVSTPDAVALDITGDIDMRIEIEAAGDLVEQATDGGFRWVLAAKDSGTGDGWIWWLGRDTSYQPVVGFTWDDGSGDEEYEFPIGESVQYERIALKFTLDVSTGAGSVFTASALDGTYVQAGVDDTSAGATAISANSAALYVAGSGLLAGATYRPLPGRVYGFELRDGIGGTLVADPDFTAPAVGASSFADSSRTWTLGAYGEISDVRWRFYGELSSIPTRWSIDGTDVYAPVTANGLLRRIRQNDDVRSPTRRTIERDLTGALAQYWPCEESGQGVLTQFGAAVGSSALTVSGMADPANNSDFAGSLALPTLGADVWTAIVDSYTDNGSWSVGFHLSVPSDFAGTNVVLLRVETDVNDYEVQHTTTGSGSIRVVVTNKSGTTLDTGAYTDCGTEGVPQRFRFAVADNGANIDVRIAGIAEDGTTSGFTDASAVTSTSAGVVSLIKVNPNVDCTGITIGHLVLLDSDVADSDLEVEVSTYSGENAAARLRRLCVEEGLASRVYGDPALSETMGPQPAATFSEMLEDIARTDLGIIHDAYDALAIGFRPRASMQAQGDRLTDPTGLQVWHSSFDALTASQDLLPNRVVGSAYGPLTFDSTNPPTVTVGSDPTTSAVDFDGTNDFATFDYIPTITATPSSSLTVIVAGKWSTAMTSAALPRMVSWESGTDFDGLAIHGGPATNDTPRVTIGGATTSVDVDPPDGALSDGDTFVFVAVVDHSDGKLYAQLDSGSRSTGASISGIGAVTYATTPRVGSLADLVTPPSVVATASAYVASGLPTVTNPDPTGSGTLIFISNCQGFGNSGTITWSSPDAAATVEATDTNTTGEFWSQCRIWSMTNDQAANYTFGGNSSDERQSGVIVALDAVADSILLAAAFSTASSAASMVYPTVNSTQADDLVLAVALQQGTDQLTSGPSGYTEEHNDTASTPNRTAVHSLLQTTSTNETPGNATWNGTAAAKTSFTLAVRGPAITGAQFGDFTLLDLVVIERALSASEATTEATRIRDRLELGVIDLDYSAGELAASPEPDRDDESIENDVTVKNRSGETARAVLDDGSALSVSQPPTGSGRYARSVTVNAEPARLPDIAQAYLDAGTVDEPRLSRLVTALHHSGISSDSALGLSILEARLGDLVTVNSNLTEWLGGAQTAQIIQGWEQRIDGYGFEDFVTFLTAPASPLRRDTSLVTSLALTPTGTPGYSRGLDTQTVTAPTATTGDTMIAITVGPYPNELTTVTWTPPVTGAEVVFDYAGVNFVNRMRCWLFAHDGSTNYTFGVVTASFAQSCTLIALDGVHTSWTVTATPVVSVLTSTPYPALSTEAGDLVLAVAGQQNTDELTAGPAGYTEEMNETAGSSSRELAVHYAYATSSAETPGDATWGSRTAAHIQWCLGLRK